MTLSGSQKRNNQTGHPQPIGYVPGCRSCSHSPGEHAIPAHHGAPQPCEVAGCDCNDLVRPDRGAGGIMRNFPGDSTPSKRGWRVA